MYFSWIFGSFLQYLRCLFFSKAQFSMVVQLDCKFICKHNVLELFIIVQLMLTPFLPLYFISIPYQLTIMWAGTNPPTLLTVFLMVAEDTFGKLVKFSPNFVFNFLAVISSSFLKQSSMLIPFLLLIIWA